MTKPFNPSGPYYIEIVFDHETPSGVEQIRTGYIDGFQTQETAFAACERFRSESVDATSSGGESITIAVKNILQFLIAKTANQVAPALAAE